MEISTSHSRRLAVKCSENIPVLGPILSKGLGSILSLKFYFSRVELFD
jgi:hypothetical protein